MTPMGIAVGTIIAALANDPSQTESSAVVRVLQIIASGALLYVAFSEVSQLLLIYHLLVRLFCIYSLPI